MSNFIRSPRYQQVVRWGVAALAVSSSAKQGTAAQKTLQFLVAAMLDRYNNDRALYAGWHLPDKPAPQRLGDIPRQIHHDNRTYGFECSVLRWASSFPTAAVDRVAHVAVHAMPDEFCLVKYTQRVITYDPLIYAVYGDWVVKVAEWV